MNFMDKDKTILIVDDERFNRLALSSLLKPRGYGCLEASGGMEGIDVLHGNPQIKIDHLLYLILIF